MSHIVDFLPIDFLEKDLALWSNWCSLNLVNFLTLDEGDFLVVSLSKGRGDVLSWFGQCGHVSLRFSKGVGGINWLS